MRLRHFPVGRVFGPALGPVFGPVFGVGMICAAGIAAAGAPARAPEPPARPAALAATLGPAPSPVAAARPDLPDAALRPPALRPDRAGPFAGLAALRRDPPAFSSRFAARADPVKPRPVAEPGAAPAETSGTLARSAPRMDAAPGAEAAATLSGLRDAPIGSAIGAPLAGAWQAGIEALGARRYADAAERFRALAERRPDLARPRLALARALSMQGDCVGARAAMAAGAANAARLAPRLAAQVEGDVARQCAEGHDWTAALALRFGLPERDVRLPGELPELGFGPARVAMAPAETAWADIGLAMTESVRPSAGLRLDLTGRGALRYAGRSPARALAEAALVAAADNPRGAAHRAGAEAALDLGPEAQAARGRLWARWEPADLRLGWAEVSTGLEASQARAAETAARMELRAAAGHGLGRVAGADYEMQAELGHAVAAAGGGARQAWAGLALRREGRAEMEHGADLALRGELFATLDAAREPGTGWRPAAVRAGARLAGVGPDAGAPSWGGVAAALELAVIRELGATDGAAVELALTQGF